MNRLLALVGLMILWTLGGRALASSVDPVTVTILPNAGGEWGASVLFPKGASRVTAQAAIQTLLSRAGWGSPAVTYSSTPALGRFPARASASFTVGTLFPKGEFPIEAFVVAFRSWGAVNVMFVHGGAFRYEGQPHYDSADATIDATANQASFALRIRIKNRRVERLTGGPPMRQTPPPAPARKGGIPLWVWPLAAAVVVSAAGVVYAIVSKRKI